MCQWDRFHFFLVLCNILLYHGIINSCTVYCCESMKNLNLRYYSKLNWSHYSVKTHDSALCCPRSRRVTPWVYWQKDKECNIYTYVGLRSLTRIQSKMPPLLDKTTNHIWSKSRQPIPRYKLAKFWNNFFIFFAHFAFLTITCECILLSSWNLVCMKG